MSKESTTESQTKTPPPTTSRKILIALLIGVCALWGLDLQAKLKWQKATNGANELMDVFDNNPATYMEKVGKSPRINVEDNKLTQVYRWTGSLKSYDLLISFRGKDGSGGIDDVEGRGTRIFGTEDISKMQLAKKTGTLDENLVIPEEDTSIEEEPDPRLRTDPGSGPGNGPGNGPSGGPGSGPGGRGGISVEQLNLEGDVKAKYELAAEKMREGMRAIFTAGGGGSREEMREKMAKLREQHETELKSILSEEQFEKYQELRDQQSQRGGRSREPGNDNSPPSEPGSRN